MRDVTHFELRLRDRLQELTERLEDVETDLGQPADPDDEERAVERESDEVLEGLGTAGLVEIRAIEAALERIADGTFGKCAACGEQISKERLNAVPHAARCRRCA
jgi:RNA polymerase-binding transcription factor DksA